MAISDRKRQAKMIDEFLASTPGQAAQGGSFLQGMDARINQRKQARRAAQMARRGQDTLQRGLTQVRGIGATPAALPQTGAAGGRAIMQQGMGPVPAPRQPLALNPGPAPISPNVPATTPPQGRIGGGPTVGPSPYARPMPGPPQGIPATTSATTQIGPGPRALGPAGSTGPIAGSTARAAAAADDAVDVAGAAMREGGDDVARAAAADAGKKTAEAGAKGLRARAANMGVNITGRSLMTGAGIAGAGYMASNFIDGLNLGGEQSILDKAGSSAIMGAGLGGGAAMALGLGAGPAGWAALGGAALFAGARSLFGGDDTKLETAQKSVTETRETIQELAGMYGIEGDALDDIMLQYDSTSQMMLDQGDTDGVKNFMAGISTQLPALMLAAREEQKADEQDQMRYQNMMAAQAQFAPMFQQQMDRAHTASQVAVARANDVSQVFDRKHPQLGELFRQTAAQNAASAANLRAAYARQLSMAPVVTGTSDELERQLAQEELLQQQLAQGVVNQ